MWLTAYKYDAEVALVVAIRLQRVFNECGDVRPVGCGLRQSVTLEGPLGDTMAWKGPQAHPNPSSL